MGDERLNMSLGDIISKEDKQKTGNRKGNTSLNVRGSNNRNQRQAAPYASSAPVKSERKNSVINHELVAIKFLLTHHMSGSLIGNGGQSIKELMELTGASVHASSSNEHYPGTNFRTIYITGTDGQVSLAQSLMWELIGQQTQTYKQTEGAVPSTDSWNPNTAYRNPGRFDTTQVEGRITVPAHAAGAILGKSGVSIRSIGDINHVVIAMCSKEDGELTKERVITITGTVSGCMGACSMVIAKMAEEEDGYSYVCNGTSYSKQAHGASSGRERESRRDQGGRGDREYDRESHRGNDNNRRNHNDNNSFLNAGRSVRDYNDSRDYGRSDNNSSYAYGGRSRAYSRDDDDRHSFASFAVGRQVTTDRDHHRQSSFNNKDSSFNLGGSSSFEGIAETLSANTVIELAVPDTLIGAILGPQGATLNEIVNLSGAKIVVSKRNEKLEGTNNRVVQITGPPASAQTAHTLVLHKLRQFSSELAEQE